MHASRENGGLAIALVLELWLYQLRRQSECIAGPRAWSTSPQRRHAPDRLSSFRAASSDRVARRSNRARADVPASSVRCGSAEHVTRMPCRVEAGRGAYDMAASACRGGCRECRHHAGRHLAVAYGGCTPGSPPASCWIGLRAAEVLAPRWLSRRRRSRRGPFTSRSSRSRHLVVNRLGRNTFGGCLNPLCSTEKLHANAATQDQIRRMRRSPRRCARRGSRVHLVFSGRSS